MANNTDYLYSKKLKDLHDMSEEYKEDYQFIKATMLHSHPDDPLKRDQQSSIQLEACRLRLITDLDRYISKLKKMKIL